MKRMLYAYCGLFILILAACSVIKQGLNKQTSAFTPKPNNLIPTQTVIKSQAFYATSTIIVSKTQTSTLVPTQTLAPSPTNTRTTTPSLTATRTKTQSPTVTQTPTLDLISRDTARDLMEWDHIGNGVINTISWWPDKNTLTVITGAGTFQYKANTLEELPPYHSQLPDSAIMPTFSADGKTAAYIMPVSGSYIVQLWDVDNKREIKQIGKYKNVPSRIALGPDGKILAVSPIYNSTDVWDVETAKLIRTVGGGLREPFFSIDSQILIYWTYGGYYGDKIISVVLWDIETRSSIYTLQPGTEGTPGLDISPDSTYLAIHKSTEVALINLRSRNYQRLLRSNITILGAPAIVKFSPDGKLLASINSEEGTLRIWDVQSGSNIKSIEGVGWVERLLFTPDSKRLITAGDQIQLWDIDQGISLFSVYGFAPIEKSFFTPDNKTIITYSDWLHEPMVWDISSRKIIPVKYKPGFPIAISSDGNLISIAIRDFEKKTERISIFDLYSGVEVLKLDGELFCDSKWGYRQLEATFSPDRNFFAAACPLSNFTGNNIFLWDLRTGDKIELWHAEASLVFNPGSSWLVTYGRKTIKFWEVSTGNLIKELYVPDTIRKVVFSPDGKNLAAYYRSGIQFWELPSFKQSYRINENIDSFTLDPIWNKLAITVFEWRYDQVKHTLKVFNLSNKKVIYHIDGNYSKTSSDADLISSPDGKVIVVKNFISNNFLIMDFDTGELLYTIQKPDFYIPYYSFSADGRILAIIDNNCSLYAVKPSSNPKPTRVPTYTMQPALMLYDNFNGATIDANKWHPSDPNDAAKFTYAVKDGKLVVKKDAKGDPVYFGLGMSQSSGVPLNQISAIEAKFYVPKQNTGRWSFVTLGLSTTLSKNGGWVTWCYLTALTEKQPYYGCSVRVNGNEEHSLNWGNINIQYGHWYTLRIEVDPQNALFQYYLDGNLIEAYRPDDWKELISTNMRFYPGISFWTDLDSAIEVWIDDVYINK